MTIKQAVQQIENWSASPNQYLIASCGRYFATWTRFDHPCDHSYIMVKFYNRSRSKMFGFTIKG